MASQVPVKLMFWGLFALPVAAVCLLSIAGFWGRTWWLFDLASHFRWQYALFLLASALVFLFGKQPKAAGGAAAFALVNLALIAPLYLRLQPASQERPVYRLLFANVLQPNHSYGLLRDLISQAEPDLIVLVEANRAWLEELGSIRQDYPYWHSQTREDHYGVALISRIPIAEAETRAFGGAGVPSIIASFLLEGKPLTVIGTHPPPPKSALKERYRNEQLTQLADFARTQKGQLLLCGDLNLSPWSPYFRSLLHNSGLHDSARGFGLQLTWPVEQPFLRLPIDHCLVSPGIEIRARRVGPSIGSDHFPLILDFSIDDEHH